MIFVDNQHTSITNVNQACLCLLINRHRQFFLPFFFLLLQVEAGQYCTFVISPEGTLHACGKVSLKRNRKAGFFKNKYWPYETIIPEAIGGSKNLMQYSCVGLVHHHHNNFKGKI